MKSLIKILLGFVVLGLGLTFAGHQYLESWQHKTLSIPGEALVEVRPGMPLKQLASQLEQKAVISSANIFTIWMKLNGDYPKLQAGTYLFKGSISPLQVLTKLKKGDVYISIALQVTIPEGFTLKMLNNRLATKGVGTLKDLNALVRKRDFISQLGLVAKTLEGYTYPATYTFEKMPTARQFYEKTVKTFFEKLPKNYEDDISKMGLTLDQAVAFASLIELETMREEEKPLIAEVIWARLKKGDTLGIDAAIIYGIDEYDGDIKWTDLKNKNNPYNTRIHRGLPPTAIGAVSRSSLEAVLKPSNLGYYYYVLDSADQTRHVFSKSLEEHNALVRELIENGGASQVKRPDRSN